MQENRPCLHLLEKFFTDLLELWENIVQNKREQRSIHTALENNFKKVRI